MNLFTVEELKTHAGIRTEKFDLDIQALVAQMSGAVEGYLGRQLEDVGSDVTQYLSARGKSDSIRLPLYPVASVTSIHVDSERAFTSTTLLASTEYQLDAASGVVFFSNPNRCWSRGRRHIQVIYQGGYTTATLPPELSLGAILWALSIWNKRRDMGVASTNFSSVSTTFRKESMPMECKGMLSRFKAVPHLEGSV